MCINLPTHVKVKGKGQQSWYTALCIPIHCHFVSIGGRGRLPLGLGIWSAPARINPYINDFHSELTRETDPIRPFTTRVLWFTRFSARSEETVHP